MTIGNCFLVRIYACLGSKRWFVDCQIFCSTLAKPELSNGCLRILNTQLIRVSLCNTSGWRRWRFSFRAVQYRLLYVVETFRQLPDGKCLDRGWSRNRLFSIKASEGLVFPATLWGLQFYAELVVSSLSRRKSPRSMNARAMQSIQLQAIIMDVVVACPDIAKRSKPVIDWF